MNPLYLALLLALLPASAAARTFFHEFGTIAEEGGAVAHTFELPAAPAGAVQSVVGAASGCPCLAVDYPRRPVAAGKPLSVTVTFDPARQQGHFTKTAWLRLSGGRRDTLVVTGTIRRTRPRVATDGYPADFGLGLRLDRPAIDFGTVRPGQRRTVTVEVLNAFEAGMSLDLRPAGPDSALIAIPYGLKLPPASASRLQATLALPAAPTAASPAPAPAQPRSLDCCLIPYVNGLAADTIPLRARLAAP